MTCFQFIIDRECPNLDDSIVEYSFNDGEMPARWPLDFWAGAFEKDSMRFTAIHNKDAEQIRVDVMISYIGMYRNEVYQKAVIAFDDALNQALYNYYIKDNKWMKMYRAELIKTLSAIRTKRIKRFTLDLCGTTVTIKKAV
ncbi:hypothetical protein [uncultured Duncaniella sp.]|uniref:hypothetical protein n=1 Tax=uncultured Duncaniella sp. TaxID=2768039 RepID=UPI0026364236|nr:hypothetical protein [uncultured Duncaniella sp.]